jgi:hypothetical protein
LHRRRIAPHWHTGLENITLAAGETLMEGDFAEGGV